MVASSTFISASGQGYESDGAMELLLSSHCSFLRLEDGQSMLDAECGTGCLTFLYPTYKNGEHRRCRLITCVHRVCHEV